MQVKHCLGSYIRCILGGISRGTVPTARFSPCPCGLPTSSYAFQLHRPSTTALTRQPRSPASFGPPPPSPTDPGKTTSAFRPPHGTTIRLRTSPVHPRPTTPSPAPLLAPDQTVHPSLRDAPQSFYRHPASRRPSSLPAITRHHPWSPGLTRPPPADPGPHPSTHRCPQ